MPREYPIRNRPEVGIKEGGRIVCGGGGFNLSGGRCGQWAWGERSSMSILPMHGRAGVLGVRAAWGAVVLVA